MSAIISSVVPSEKKTLNFASASFFIVGVMKRNISLFYESASTKLAICITLISKIISILIIVYTA